MKYLCKVYNRKTFNKEDPRRPFYDYKIKVIQMAKPKSWDYVVLRKLPIDLRTEQDFKDLEEEIKKNFFVQLNRFVKPSPIEYCTFTTHGAVIHSQRYHDQHVPQNTRFDVTD